MGGQASRPPPPPQTTSYGQAIAIASAERVTFDPNTGSVNRTIKTKDTSNSETWTPDDKIDLNVYIQKLNEWKMRGREQNPNYPISIVAMSFDSIGTQVGAEAIGQATTAYGQRPPGSKGLLPMVTAWQIKNPPVRAVVYTDLSGDSKFLYKNDPGNIVQLVKNGSKVAAGVSSGATAQTSVAGIPQNECEKFRRMMQSCGAGGASAPAPAAPVGESGYLAEGMAPVMTFTGGYPTWVLVMALVALILAFLIARKA